MRIGHTADIKNLVADFAAFQPTFVLAVPRVFEKVYNSAKQRASPTAGARIFDRAAGSRSRGARARDRQTRAAGPRASTACSTGWSTLGCARRSAAGATYAISGGAPLGDRLGHFFRGIGVNVSRATG